MIQQIKTPRGMGVLIVRFDALTYKRGKYRFLKKPFSGVAMKFSETGLVTEAKRYRKGRAIGNYESPYFPQAKGVPRYNADYLDYYSVYEVGYDIDPHPYSLVYDFEEMQMCFSEELIVGKMRESYIYFDLYNGVNIGELYINRSPLFEHYAWNSQGMLHHVHISEKRPASGDQIFSWEIDYSDKKKDRGRVKSISLYGDPFVRIRQLKEKLSFNYRADRKIFRTMKAAERLCLFGNALDNEIFLNICSHKGLKHVEELVISRTAITADALLKIRPSRKIKQIDLNKIDISPQDLERLRSRFVNCKITLEND